MNQSSTYQNYQNINNNNNHNTLGSGPKNY